MARIVIVGAGVVGTATGKGFTQIGHSVSFVDVDPRRVETLRREGFAVSEAVDLSGPGAYVFLSPPTPHGGCGYDLSALDAATTTVGEALRGATSYHTIVVRSTVPPGTCEGRVQRLLEESSGRRAGEDFSLASNPEFLRSVSAREDFLMPWMTVVGSRSRRTAERLAELYRPFGGQIKTFSDPAEAELVKCAHNLYNATKISFWNEMWLVARTLGIPLDGVAQTVAHSAEGSINPEYGIRAGSAYGGACLPKDTKGFLGFAAELGLEMPMLAGVVRVNEIIAGESGADLAAEAHALATEAEVRGLPGNSAVHGNGRS
jgi:UDPglucose 6-dehydrogenase